MTDAPEKPYRGNRRFLWLAIGVIVVIAAYTAGWFYIGGQLEAQTLARIERLKASGRIAACDKPEARGFPFRMGLFCDRVARPLALAARRYEVRVEARPGRGWVDHRAER